MCSTMGFRNLGSVWILWSVFHLISFGAASKDPNLTKIRCRTGDRTGANRILAVKSDPTKYKQCDPAGSGYYKVYPCVKDSVFTETLQRCVPLPMEYSEESPVTSKPKPKIISKPKPKIISRPKPKTNQQHTAKNTLTDEASTVIQKKSKTKPSNVQQGIPSKAKVHFPLRHGTDNFQPWFAGSSLVSSDMENVGVGAAGYYPQAIQMGYDPNAHAGSIAGQIQPHAPHMPSVGGFPGPSGAASSNPVYQPTYQMPTGANPWNPYPYYPHPYFQMSGMASGPQTAPETKQAITPEPASPVQLFRGCVENSTCPFNEGGQEVYCYHSEDSTKYFQCGPHDDEAGIWMTKQCPGGLIFMGDRCGRARNTLAAIKKVTYKPVIHITPTPPRKPLVPTLNRGQVHNFIPAPAPQAPQVAPPYKPVKNQGAPNYGHSQAAAAAQLPVKTPVTLTAAQQWRSASGQVSADQSHQGYATSAQGSPQSAVNNPQAPTLNQMQTYMSQLTNTQPQGMSQGALQSQYVVPQTAPQQLQNVHIQKPKPQLVASAPSVVKVTQPQSVPQPSQSSVVTQQKTQQPQNFQLNARFPNSSAASSQISTYPYPYQFTYGQTQGQPAQPGQPGQQGRAGQGNHMPQGQPAQQIAAEQQSAQFQTMQTNQQHGQYPTTFHLQAIQPATGPKLPSGMGFVMNPQAGPQTSAPQQVVAPKPPSAPTPTFNPSRPMGQIQYPVQQPQRFILSGQQFPAHFPQPNNQPPPSQFGASHNSQIGQGRKVRPAGPSQPQQRFVFGHTCSLMISPKAQLLPGPPNDGGKTFYMCLPHSPNAPTDRGVWVKMRCPNGTLFNTQKQICEKTRRQNSHS